MPDAATRVGPRLQGLRGPAVPRAGPRRGIRRASYKRPRRAGRTVGAPHDPESRTMRLLSFLAGLAAGLLLAPAARRPATDRRMPAPAMTGERDFPTHARPRNDAEITERIRSQLQRTIQSPQAVEVDVREGCVTLRGRVQARDVRLLLAEVDATAGVTEVRNELRIEGELPQVGATRQQAAAPAPATA